VIDDGCVTGVPPVGPRLFRIATHHHYFSMPITFSCDCGKRLKTPDDWGGRWVRLHGVQA
jgi:hypothetical protein